MLVSKKDVINFASDWENLKRQGEEAEEMLESSAKSKWQSLKKSRAEELFNQIPIDRISDTVENMP